MTTPVSRSFLLFESSMVTTLLVAVSGALAAGLGLVSGSVTRISDGTFLGAGG